MSSEPGSEPAAPGAGEPGRGGSGARSRGPGRTQVLIGLAVLVVAGAVVVWVVERGDPEVMTGVEATEAFLAASERNLDATYRLDGEFRRTLDDGRELVSGLLVVQRPPDRLQRSLGSTAGVVAGRTVNCGTPSVGDYGCATSGGADPWELRRAEQLEALEDYVLGPDPLYTVEDTGDECFTLARQRDEPAAVYGMEAELCFDPATGGLRRLEVHREGGAVDVLEGLMISGEVGDADFDLSADGTYDPHGA